MLPTDFLQIPLAHRGLHDAQRGLPENSLAAIEAARDAGYGIELDVQLSGDGQAMVFHDATLDRMTDARGPVGDRPAAELSALTLNHGGGGIPRLDTVLAAVAGRVPVLIEMKDQSHGQGASEPRLERAVAAAVADYPGPVAVMSFNPYMVAAMQSLAPDCPRGLVTEAFAAEAWPDLPQAARQNLRDIATRDQVGAQFISHDWRDLGRGRVAEIKAAGLPVLCWTVKSPEAEALARQVADNITFEGYRPAVPAAAKD